MSYINSTPHVVNVFSTDGTQLFALPPGLDIRASSSETVASCEDGVLVVKQELGAPVIKDLEGNTLTIADLPATGLVVSMIAASSLRSAGFGGQLLTPNTAPGRVVRDAEGRILGCTGFVQQP